MKRLEEMKERLVDKDSVFTIAYRRDIEALIKVTEIMIGVLEKQDFNDYHEENCPYEDEPCSCVMKEVKDTLVKVSKILK